MLAVSIAVEVATTVAVAAVAENCLGLYYIHYVTVPRKCTQCIHYIHYMVVSHIIHSIIHY